MPALDEAPQDPFEPIAIIGLAALLPDAEDAAAFWQNVLAAKVSIREVPKERWDADDFWVEGAPKNVDENKTYAKIGAFVEGYEFDWRRWRQPPGTLPQIDLCQQWAVTVSAAALENAGYMGDDPRGELPKQRCGVVFANALGGENRNLSNQRVWADKYARLAVEAGMPESGKQAFKQAVTDGTPKVNEDTMPGELANVVAGRVANLLDLQGPNYTTDAACATTFAAILDACRLLQTRQVDMMLAGASDRTMDPATFAKFSAIGALSATHSTPFDSRANGFVMGEGAGCVVLKRLGEAIADGDSIQAVIRGVGASSDGRGKGITAPSQRGQVQAVIRACQQAGYGTDTIGLIEAHGTSTVVGDATELNSLTAAFDGVANGEIVAVGSIKSQIGHLKAAAGVAGLLKAIYAVKEGIIPPSAGFVTPNENVSWNENPFYVPSEPRPWPSAAGHPRRAGISAFGFGGTNFHCAIEEYDENFHTQLAAEFGVRRAAWLNPTAHGAAHTISEGQAGQVAATVGLDSGARMSWEQLKAVEGGVLLINADDVSSLKSAVGKITAELFDAAAGANFDDSPDGRRLSIELPKVSANYRAEGTRLAIVATSWAQLQKRLDLFQKSVEDRDRWLFMSKQMVMISDEPALPAQAKVAHMYPGQGSQYVGMTFDLCKRYRVVGETWDEADRTMVEILDGETLSSFVLRENLSEAEQKQAEFKLKQTEYTQPSMLTADLALYRLLKQHGLTPDMVAGHSLGEYAALMVSGILQFHDALRAAAARGTEMGSVDVPDNGIMASVTAPFDVIMKVLDETDGYVIAANKNSPKMTVIAGETAPMRAVMRIFENRGISCLQLATSHAFHSRIVAPANEPLRRFLDGLEINLPSIPITSNYDGGWYPEEAPSGSDGKSAVLEKLAPQMSSAVEWSKQIETMYEGGARLFVEVGPKRALALFAEQILEEEDKVVCNTNHPKVGGVASFLAALAVHALAGRIPNMRDSDSSVLTDSFRAAPRESTIASAGISEVAMVPISATPAASGAGSSPNPNRDGLRPSPVAAPIATELMSEDEKIAALHSAKEAFVGDIVAAATGYPRRMIHGSCDLQVLGISDAVIGGIIAAVSAAVKVKPGLDSSTLITLPALVGWLDEVPGGEAAAIAQFGPKQSTPQSPASPTTPSSSGQVDTSPRPSKVLIPATDPLASRRDDPFVVSGISLGLPGMSEVFAPDALDRIMAGENFISELPDEIKQRLLDKNLIRIVKHQDGSAEFVVCDSFEMIPQLAGRAGYFDLAEQYGIDEKIVAAMDISTTLAFAAGLESLKDAGLPLFPVEQVNKAGKRLIQKWHLHDSVRDRTGVIFASCFPGLNMAMRHARNNGADEDGNFDRRFLLQVLTMGHSQFAQWIGARGPNASINNACASTPAAFAIAEDWMTTGRCDRVIVVSGDDVTSDELMEWVGAGFAGAGAHAIGNVVEEVSLPFDARRNGMLMGMGGAAFVIERQSDSTARGVIPYAELLGAHIGNSAYHPTRLDVDHVSASLDSFMSKMEGDWGFDRHEIAEKMTFMSHEPATPPRGGSASSEIQALRQAFGDSANKIVITNTKGFTGHPMAVGIEDAVVIRSLAEGRLPPIANFKQPDPELGNLRLSKGGEYDVDYALRHAAGFGSQMALTLLRRIARGLGRIDGDRLHAWAEQTAGGTVKIRILQRKLVVYVNPNDNLIGGVAGEPFEPAVLDAVAVLPATAMAAARPVVFIEPEPILTAKEIPTPVPAPTPEPAPAAPSAASPVAAAPIAAAPSPATDVDAGDVEAKVVEVVVSHTGYPADFIELDQDLEGELGIDTVKQAEIMAELREHYSLPVDESFVLSEHPTLNHMIAYLSEMGDGSSVSSAPTPAPTPVVRVEVEPELDSAPTAVAEVGDAGDAGDVEAKVVEVVVTHTGYPADFIELDQDLEGELGIDTVKQAEIMAELREHYSLPVDESFVLSEHPTLNHMIAYLSEMGGGGTVESIPPASPTPTPTPSEPTEVPTPEPEAKPAPTPTEPTYELVEPESVESESSEPEICTVRRWQVEVEEAPPEAHKPLEIKGRVVAVTDDPWGIADTLCHILCSAGIDAVRIMLDPSIVSKVKTESDGPVDIIRVNPGNKKQLEQVAAQLLSRGDLAALIHLAPLRLTGVGWESETQDAHLTTTTHGLFGLLKTLDSHLAGIDDAAVVSVSAMDGRHGSGGSRFNALAAGSHGIVKSYAREHPHLRCRAIDVDPELLSDPAALANTIWAETFGRVAPLEVGIERDGTRWALRLYEENLESERIPLASDDVWLVSGGGAGVTARCIIGVAEASPNAGATFVLLGRTKLNSELEEWLHDDEASLAKRKMDLRESMQADSPDGKVTLVEWEDAWGQQMRGLDIHRTIRAIQASGNRALYNASDVTKAKSISKIIRAIRSEFGAITGLIHGAGMEDSKLVSDKSWDTFSQVISVKIDGWRAMVDGLGDDISDLRLACAFTSVAGRFGNAGQVDYAAANNILDAEMCRISHHEDAPRAVAIAWSGWKDVGMASKGSIETVFKSAGIEMIPVNIGVERFVDEVLAGGKRRVVVAGRLGALDAESSLRIPPQRLTIDTAMLLSDADRFPFVDRVVAHTPYSWIVTQCTLDEQRFPFLSDHSIDGTPYHPGVMALEMFAETSMLLYPMCTLSGFESVDYGLPIKLVRDEANVRVVATFAGQDSRYVRVECRLESDLVNKAGEVFGEPRVHHTATVLLLKAGAEADGRDAPFAGPPSRSKASFQPEFIYKRFFHGPRFQAHGGLVKGVQDGDDFGADGIALMATQLPNSELFSVEEGNSQPQLEATPMLVEACFQNAGLVAMEVEGLSSLPIGIERVEIIRQPDEDENLRLRSYQRANEGEGITRHDAVVFDDDNNPVVILRGLRLKGMAPVPEKLLFSLTRKG